MKEYGQTLWEIYSIHKDSFENVTRIYNKLVMYSKSPVCTVQKNLSKVQSKLKLLRIVGSFHAIIRNKNSTQGESYTSTYYIIIVEIILDAC